MSHTKTKRRRRGEFKYTSSPARIEAIHAMRLRLGLGSAREVIDRAVDLLNSASAHVDATGTIKIITPDERVLLCAVGCPQPYDEVSSASQLSDIEEDADDRQGDLEHWLGSNGGEAIDD